MNIAMNIAWSIVGITLVVFMGISCDTRMRKSERPIESGRVLPTVQDRLTERVLIETLIIKNGSEYVVRDAEGELEGTVLVDQRTKLDAVTAGEAVRIYMTDEGHAMTVQRVIE